MYPITRRFLVLAVSLLAVTACRSSNPYKGLSDQQLYDRAQEQFKKGDYSHTIRLLNHLTLTFGNSPLVPEAQLLLAKADYAAKDYLTAHADYQTFLQRYPNDPRAADAALGACDAMAHMSPIAERDQTYTKQAITICDNVIADYPGTDQASQATTMVNDMREKLAKKEYLDAEFYLRRNLYDSAIKYFEFVVSDYPQTDWAPKALMGVYKANKAIGYDDLAEKAKQRLMDKYPDSKEAKALEDDGSNG